MSDLMDQNKALREQVKDFTAALTQKDTKLTLLNVKLAKGAREGLTLLR